MPSVTTSSLAPGASLIVELEVEQREQPRAAGRGAGEGIDHQAELAHRHLQDGHEGEELRPACRRDLAGDHLVAADPEHQPHRGEEREVHRAGIGHADIDALVGEVERLLLGLVELFELVLLRGEGAHHADAAEVLVHHAGQYRSFSCSVSQVARSMSCIADERQATNGTKLSARSPSSRSVVSSR